MSRLRVISFGGGVQSTAVGVLWAHGEIEADVALFADPGGEMPETYENVERMQAWLADRGRALVTVRRPGPALLEHSLETETLIPAKFGAGGIFARGCTREWKIRPMRSWARDHGADTLEVLLGISIDEVHRMKAAPVRWVEHVYPLIDLRLTRAVCREIIEGAGLPVPVRSACYFCPLHASSHWRRLARGYPELFRRTLQLEAVLQRRHEAFLDGADIYIAGRVSLERAAEPEQPAFPGWEAAECEGVCFV